jgi:hypothetical protein
MGREKRSHLQQFGKFCFQKPKNPLTKRKDPLSERRAPLSERRAPLSEGRAPLSTRKLRCAGGAARAYMRAIDRDLAKDVKPRCQTIGEVFFYFAKNFRMSNLLYAKLLEMLLKYKLIGSSSKTK